MFFFLARSNNFEFKVLHKRADRQYSSTTQPPTVVCKLEAQLEYIRTHFTHVFARLVLICMLSGCLLAKVSASEISRNFIRSVLSVGCSLVYTEVLLCWKIWSDYAAFHFAGCVIKKINEVYSSFSSSSSSLFFLVSLLHYFLTYFILVEWNAT